MLAERVQAPDVDAEGYFAVDARGTRLGIRLEPGEYLVGAHLVFEVPESSVGSLSSIDHPTQFLEQRDEQGGLEWLSLELGYTARIRSMLLQDAAGPGPAGSVLTGQPGLLSIHQGGPWYPPASGAELGFDRALAQPALQAAGIQVRWADLDLKPQVTQPELVLELETRPDDLRLLIEGAAPKQLGVSAEHVVVCELAGEDLPDLGGGGGALQMTLFAGEPGLIRFNADASNITIERRVDVFSDADEQPLGPDVALDLAFGMPGELHIALGPTTTGQPARLVGFDLALFSDDLNFALQPGAAGVDGELHDLRAAKHLSPERRLAQRFQLAESDEQGVEAPPSRIAIDVFLRPLGPEVEVQARVLANSGGRPDPGQVVGTSSNMPIKGGDAGPWPGRWQRFEIDVTALAEPLWFELASSKGEVLWSLSQSEQPAAAAEFSLGDYVSQSTRGLALRAYRALETPVWPEIQLIRGGNHLPLLWPAEGRLALTEELAVLESADDPLSDLARLVFSSQQPRRVVASELSARLRQEI